ncbi:hypothetical protein B296_00020219 [Ensete ventricosum]|uniref:Uncharacterized protein n=1 Tax=Ensete ventricosum TaxID=4639 RepID=A0A426Z7Y1_ENSVE|nr:hypothetical protein B296_00020219 [Ensete ventricosum]
MERPTMAAAIVTQGKRSKRQGDGFWVAIAEGVEGSSVGVGAVVMAKEATTLMTEAATRVDEEVRQGVRRDSVVASKVDVAATSIRQGRDQSSQIDGGSSQIKGGGCSGRGDDDRGAGGKWPEQQDRATTKVVEVGLGRKMRAMVGVRRPLAVCVRGLAGDSG